MNFNSRLEEMSPDIAKEFHKWESILSKNASDLLGLRYMDNRSMDSIHSRNLTVHPIKDSNSQLLYMVKLFYKRDNSSNEEYIYIGFRINSEIEQQFNACLSNVDTKNVQKNVIFGNHQPDFLCIKLLNTTEEVIVKLIRNYIALALIANNSI